MTQRMRISDIATEAGVSPATVSRFLNKRYDAMSEATRRRIAEVVKRTGYRPSNAARSLRLDRSNTLGLVLADIQNPYSGAMIEALDKRAAARGLSIITAISDNDRAREAESIARLVDAGVDGLIVNTCGGNDELLVTTNATTPVVLLDRALDEGLLDLVTSNNAKLMQQLLDELREAGAAHYLLVTEPDDASPIRRERAEVFSRGLRARGFAGEVVPLSANVNEAAQQLETPLSACSATQPLGIVAINGLMLLKLVEVLGALEINGEAENLRLATFDDYAWNRVLFGGITAAVQDTGEIAAAILNRLDERLAREEKAAASDAASFTSVRIEVPGSVARRASTLPR